MNFKKVSIVAGLITVAIILGYLSLLLYVTKPISSYSMSSAAALGDSFGIINALFSGLAFAGLIITVQLQRQELRESREIFKSQKFEDAFYRLLDYYRNNLNEISISFDEQQLSGVATLSHQLKKFQSASKISLTSDVDEERLYERINNTLIPQSRYLGTLESLLSLVVRDVSNVDDEKFYIKIIASQLTVHEVKYIFYRCLSMETDSDLVEVIDRSKLLHLRVRGSDIPERYIRLYNKKHGDRL